MCEALKNTGLCGSPEEYFLGPEAYTPSWERSAWAHSHRVKTRQEYLDLVLQSGTTPNGVFGCKIMWNYFPEIQQKLSEMPEYQTLTVHSTLQSIFPNLHYIWIRRRDQVRQAVSWAKAAQTGVYAWPKGETPVQQRQPEYDFEFISNLHKLIIESEQGWQAYFKRSGVQPYTILYEDLVQNYEGTAKMLLRHMGIAAPDDLVFGERRLQKQSDAVNDQWAERYIRQAGITNGYTIPIHSEIGSS